MALQNGQLPDSELASIPGGRLRKDAARAWNTMVHGARPIHVRDSYRVLGHKGDLARGVWSQWTAWERYQRDGSPLAARPGTSNHGWGTAVDLSDEVDRWNLVEIGAPFGWSKKWSDAPLEWWHILYNPAIKPFEFRQTLKQGSSGDSVYVLQAGLNLLGNRLIVDGSFGPATQKIVQVFQQHRGLNHDGVVGGITWSHLFG